MAISSLCLPSLGSVLEGGLWVCQQGWSQSTLPVFAMGAVKSLANVREQHKHSQGSNIPTAKEHGSYKPNLSVLEHYPPCTFSGGGHWRMNVDELHSVHLPGCYKPTAGRRGVCWCSVSTTHSAQVEMCPSEIKSLTLMHTLVNYSVLLDRGETDPWQLLISLYYALVLL